MPRSAVRIEHSVVGDWDRGAEGAPCGGAPGLRPPLYSTRADVDRAFSHSPKSRRALASSRAHASACAHMLGARRPLLRLHLVSTPLALGFSCAEILATQRAPHPAQGLRLISAKHARLGSSALPVSSEAQCPSPPFPSLREPPLLPPAESPAAVRVPPTPSFRTCLRRMRFGRNLC